MKNVAIIPARGGSKGIIRKNVKNLCGKPLIAWTIEDALSSSNIDSVYVSTDCPEISAIAKSYGAEVPYLRPSNLSGDNCTTESAITHFCEWSIKKHIEIDRIVLLQPTSPIRMSSSINAAISYFEKNACDSLLGVCESHRFFWSKKLEDNLAASYDFMNRPRRQDIMIHDKKYLENGSIYISDFKGYMSHKNRLFGKIGMYEMQEIESHEIDTETDFIVCEALIHSLKKREIK
ncbi:acylneuraminate cytidylyltransferase family protein [Amylibacter sp.]|nr:acylneuraminate cytidylyltransferase family protein [Amylibacter sp.]